MKTKFKQTEIGEIPEEWAVSELNEVVEKIIDYRGKTPIKTLSGVPLITAKIVKDGRINYSSLEYIAKSEYDSWMRRGLPEAGDVVLTTEAPLGEVAQVPDFKIALAQRIITLRGKKDVLNNSYLKYYFLSNIGNKQLSSKESGSVVTGIKQSELRKIKVVIPAIKEQLLIVDTLSSLDNKIELNRKMNKTLEETAKALFKHWFIDFEFPNEEGKPYKSNGGQMIESEFGLIPKKWQVSTLKEICQTISNGGTPSRGNNLYWEKGDIPWIKTGELNDGVIFESEENITKLGLTESSTKLLPENSILIAIYAAPTVGRLGILKCKATSNQACTGLVANEDITSYLHIYYWLMFSRSYFNTIAVGAAQQNISKQIIEETKIILPPFELVKKSKVVLEGIWNEITYNSKQIKTLSKVRDSLLPKLMSGKIRVK